MPLYPDYLESEQEAMDHIRDIMDNLGQEDVREVGELIVHVLAVTPDHGSLRRQLAMIAFLMSNFKEEEK